MRLVQCSAERGPFYVREGSAGDEAAILCCVHHVSDVVPLLRGSPLRVMVRVRVRVRVRVTVRVRVRVRGRSSGAWRSSVTTLFRAPGR